MNKNILFVSAAAILSASGVAYAEPVGQDPSEGASSTPAGDIGDIVVTAQRKEQKLQDVPLAVTAVNADQAQALGLRSVLDIAKVTPGARFQKTAGFFQAYIRGIGTQYVTVGLESQVPVYDDGAYLTRNLGVSDLLQNFDIGSIQVLRGPQGTLYGRNATGGVIIINTADPTPRVEARLRGEVGNIDHQSTDAMINLPITETLSFRGTASYRHDGGYVEDIPTGIRYGGGTSYSVRGKLRWRPSSSTDIILGGQYTKLRTRNDTLRLHPGSRDTCLGCIMSGVDYSDTSFYKANKNAVLFPARSEYYGANLRIQQDVGAFTLQSTSTYRRQDVRNNASDSDLTGLDLFVFDNRRSGGRTFTQDFQATSNFDGPLNFLVGASYYNDRGIFDPEFRGSFYSATLPTLGAYPSFANVGRTKSYAAFAEAYFDLTDELKVTLGGRYTEDKRSLVGETNPAFGQIVGVPGGFTFKENSKQNAFTPRFVLAWDNGPTNVYYSYTRGFKAGGFPGPAVFPVNEVQPEKIASHEIGFKQSALDGHLSLRVAAFYLKNKNQQVPFLDFNSGGTIVTNAGGMKNYGLEVEGQYDTPLEGLTMGFSGAWQHARYQNYVSAPQFCQTAPGVPLFACFANLSGTTPPQTPEWSGSLNSSYDFAIGEWAANLAGLVTYRSEIDITPGAGGVLRTDHAGSLALVNVSGYVSPPAGTIRFGFYVDNVFDAKYVLAAETSPYGFSEAPAPPRTYGLRLEYNY
ncbi:TonB-dependent receptor [Rhizorhabdus argentea]|uniref:TonB-dependent receptor n=1 Tax=Rhizorhabdus argentea TaxID=1387174 RepID=UPI0030ED12AB